MQRMMLKCKIHRVRVTEADLHYEGSITLDAALMREAGLIPYEMVQVYNISNGQRFETYCLEGPEGSGVVCLNGAAARCAVPGDLLIVACYAPMDEEEALVHRPRIVLVDECNRPLP